MRTTTAAGRCHQRHRRSGQPAVKTKKNQCLRVKSSLLCFRTEQHSQTDYFDPVVRCAEEM